MDRFTAIACALRGGLTLFCTWLSARFGVLVPVMGILLLAMALDLVKSWIACIRTGSLLISAE